MSEGENYRDEFEFTDWISRHAALPSVQTEYMSILSWVKIASEGNKNLYRILREEEKAHAFPPKTKFLEKAFGENLRLYCMLIGNRTIIVFNGGIKTAGIRRAQDCPTVGPYFRMANKLCKAIEEGIREGEIDIDHDTGQIKEIDKIELAL